MDSKLIAALAMILAKQDAIKFQLAKHISNGDKDKFISIMDEMQKHESESLKSYVDSLDTPA
jgi:hypothetical protein